METAFYIKKVFFLTMCLVCYHWLNANNKASSFNSMNENDFPFTASLMNHGN